MITELFQIASRFLKRNHIGSTELPVNNKYLETPTCENVLSNFKAAELNKQRSTPSFNFSNKNNREPVVIGNRPSLGLGIKLDLSKNKTQNYHAPVNSPEESTSECNLKKKDKKTKSVSKNVVNSIINEAQAPYIKLPDNYFYLLNFIFSIFSFIAVILNLFKIEGHIEVHNKEYLRNGLFAKKIKDE
ncbi:MAG: hypothetical protein AM1032_000004 [Mycoplasmataceae bacterium]|nr:MAG: hypothetical protein AM1032_000004 [Mycoplasmataceae bacterium]